MAFKDNPKISELRHRIKFQSLSRVPDGQGGYVSSWVDYVQPGAADAFVWAKIAPREARENYFTDQIRPTITHTIVVRKIDGITAEMRVVFGSRTFQIKGAFKYTEENWYMQIPAEENVAS